jgi:prephenate dehydratase
MSAPALGASAARTEVEGRPRIAFLGPRGSFTEMALLARPESRDADLVPAASVPTALAAVRSGEVSAAMVPMENSVEGSVSVTLDDLASGEPLVIVAEHEVPIRFALLARPGTALADVRVIATHPHGEAQCRGWVREHLPEATVVLALSNSAAAAELAPDAAAPAHDAAIAHASAAEHYGLEVLADDIGEAQAATRFVLVTKPRPAPRPTGADKTTLALYMRADHSGALMEILTELAVRGINLTRIESRPTKVAMGHYFFVVDAEGHIDDERLGEALMGLRRVCAQVRYLGSYARFDGNTPEVRTGTSDADFVDAAAWLARVREGRTAQ